MCRISAHLFFFGDDFLYRTESLFDLTKSMAGDYLKRFEYPWMALSGIKELIINIGNELDKKDFDEILPFVWVHKSAIIAPSAFIGAPCIINDESEVRHGAFIRGAALVGRGCVIGNSVEVKNAILFDKVQVPHYNYVGDSILGYKSHMGAGAITSNVKSDKSLVTVNYNGMKIKTRLKKFGAILGDCVEVGCNCVLNPGTVVCSNSNIYPLSCVRGVVPSGSIYKSGGIIVPKI